MLKYLKAAFFVRPSVPGLGRVPVNVLAVVVLGIVGLVAHWVLPLVVGLEVAFLAMLSSNRRFQRLVDAEESAHYEGRAEQSRRLLVERLPQASRKRLADLEARCAQALQIQHDAGGEAYVIDGNKGAFDKLAWIYLKLLIARQHLQSEDVQTARRQLAQQLADLQRDLANPDISSTVRESKTATQELLLRRQEMLSRKEGSIQEIESDLTRIEAQIELAVEQARLRRTPEEISTNIDFVSQLLDDDAYGASSDAVAAVEATYRA